MLTLLNSNQPALINWHNLSTAQKNDLFLALKSKNENRGILSKIGRYLDMGLRNLSKLFCFGLAAKQQVVWASCHFEFFAIHGKLCLIISKCNFDFKKYMVDYFEKRFQFRHIYGLLS